MEKTLKFVAIALASLSLWACSGTRNLSKPQLDLPATFSNQELDSLTYADIRWWEFYSDENLRFIIEKTLTANRDLLKASARMEELRQLYGVEKLNLAPTVSGVIGGSYETNNYSGKGVTKDHEYDFKATVNWEVNLWGAMKWSRRQAQGNFLASVEDRRAMQMSLIAEVATAYFNLIALDNELAIVRQTLLTRRESLDQAKLRYEGGLTSETVYQQAVVEYSSTAALVPGLERQVKISLNAIALLMGEYPGRNLRRSHLYLDATMPDSVMTGLPSQLLKRRPDLRAAEQRLASAMAAVGVSYADRFPNFRIAFTGGLENDKMTDFLRSPFTYTLGNITGTILDFGRKKRRYKASIEAYEQARLEYEQCVMTAFTEVDNAVETYRRVRESTALRENLRDAALKYVELARLQYRAGTLNYIDVLDAQRRYFDAQIGFSNARRDEYLALVNLYKVLGGGAD